ncbi:4Fe-4S binding protein [Bacteroidota bacterium]
MKNKVIKSKSKPIQKYRFWVQSVFVLLCIWIGLEFHFFVEYLESGGSAEFYERPPGVEAFLPISALMSVYYFVLSGVIHNAHPAGFFILLGVITVSFVFGKSFCSWICPVGFLSELIGDFGDKVSIKLFKRKIKVPALLDYPLRSLKYLLLGFFVYSIFFSMTELALKYFLDSSYNVISDVKMYYFFADISRFSLLVIAVLFGLSIIFRNFWCRYLCPYGALLGILSLLSSSKIKRNTETCIDCNLCTKACPSFIKVDKVKTVISDECSTCLNCVDACPVKDTLELKTVYLNKRIPKKFVAFGIILIYIAVTGFGIISGHWHNNISKEEYLKNYNNINSIGHPRSTEDIDRLNEISKGETANERSKLD